MLKCSSLESYIGEEFVLFSHQLLKPSKQEDWTRPAPSPSSSEDRWPVRWATFPQVHDAPTCAKTSVHPSVSVINLFAYVIFLIWLHLVADFLLWCFAFCLMSSFWRFSSLYIFWNLPIFYWWLTAQTKNKKGGSRGGLRPWAASPEEVFFSLWFSKNVSL